MGALRPLVDQGQITILKAIDSKEDPVLSLMYRPAAPGFTIRHILRAINDVDSVYKGGRFQASVYYPPTLETLSRQLLINERKVLLFRVILTFLIAIPTFVIGIVWMTLLPATHPLRMYIEEPMWAGTTSRAVWALFFLATPVQFYTAIGFHRRSFKELRALWRKGSKTPIYKRFIRFGSMDLLISLGVSISYFSSIALLAISSAQSPQRFGVGDTTTYFDSVVFLTMFLLFGMFMRHFYFSVVLNFDLGRYLEMYSKSRTADAVSSLAQLRPAKALLVTGPDDPAFKQSSKMSDPDDLEKGSIHLDDMKLKQTVAISTSLLEIHDIVRVVHGSSPPADGVIVSQETSLFDESSLTGESRLVSKGPGDRIYVGTLCRGQPVDVMVDKLDGQSM